MPVACGRLVEPDAVGVEPRVQGRVVVVVVAGGEKVAKGPVRHRADVHLGAEAQGESGVGDAGARVEADLLRVAAVLSGELDHLVVLHAAFVHVADKVVDLTEGDVLGVVSEVGDADPELFAGESE